ncbi:MAG: hypothetical protein GX892_16215 [Thermoanaerobacteraceae bacterium]|nr:hypothetical protein [Thermoanaerobacteraceae bacterium]
MTRINGYLEGIYTFLSPLSHIGDSHGPDSFLATQEILDPNGRPIEVFTYSGNAIRGVLRDCGSKYFLDRLGRDWMLKVPLDVFYLLFSGGSIGGNQSIDIDQARRIREAVPIISIPGGGVGNQILAGKMCVNDAYPVCKECKHIIPGEYFDDAEGDLLSWRQMTTERSYTRTDDAKDENKRAYLQDENQLKLKSGEQMMLLSDGEGNKKEKNKKKDEAPVQMRYTIEVMQTGTKLWHRIDIRDMTEVEFGALASCLVEWSKSPYLGGQNRIGMGRAMLMYNWHPVGGGSETFIDTTCSVPLLGNTASEAKQKYDEYIDKYAAYLDEHKEGLVKLIDAKS